MEHNEESHHQVKKIWCNSGTGCVSKIEDEKTTGQGSC